MQRRNFLTMLLAAAVAPLGRVFAKPELEAVGQDVDGVAKPIDELSYKPEDGWDAEPVLTGFIIESRPIFLKNYATSIDSIKRSLRLRFSNGMEMPVPERLSVSMAGSRIRIHNGKLPPNGSRALLLSIGESTPADCESAMTWVGAKAMWLACNRQPKIVLCPPRILGGR